MYPSLLNIRGGNTTAQPIVDILPIVVELLSSIKVLTNWHNTLRYRDYTAHRVSIIWLYFLLKDLFFDLFFVINVSENLHFLTYIMQDVI